eukprot:s1943_g1.t1
MNFPEINPVVQHFTCTCAASPPGVYNNPQMLRRRDSRPGRSLTHRTLRCSTWARHTRPLGSDSEKRQAMG